MSTVAQRRQFLVNRLLTPQRCQKAFNAVIKMVGDREVEVVASTEERDRAGDVVVQKGIDTTAYQANPIVLWQHDQNEPIARATSFGVVDGEFRAIVRFASPGISAVADKCFGLVKDEIINGVSLGFLPMETEPVDDKKPWAGVRFLRSELLEFSFVSIPANRGAGVIARQQTGAMWMAQKQLVITRKGLYQVAALAQLLRELGWLQEDVDWEAQAEQDASRLPAMLGDAMRLLGECLVAMTQEEVAELLANVENAGEEMGEPQMLAVQMDVIKQLAKTNDAGAVSGFASILKHHNDGKQVTISVSDGTVIRSGKTISAANMAHLTKAMDHHNEIGACIKAVMDSGVTPPDDEAKSLRERVETLERIIKTVEIRDGSKLIP